MLNNWVKSRYNGKKLYYKSNQQLKVCGSVVEFRRFQSEFYVGGRPETAKSLVKEDAAVETSKELAQKQRFWRAKRQFYDWINCNVFAWPNPKTGRTDPPSVYYANIC